MDAASPMPNVISYRLRGCPLGLRGSKIAGTQSPLLSSRPNLQTTCHSLPHKCRPNLDPSAIMSFSSRDSTASYGLDLPSPFFRPIHYPSDPTGCFFNTDSQADGKNGLIPYGPFDFQAHSFC